MKPESKRGADLLDAMVQHLCEAEAEHGVSAQESLDAMVRITVSQALSAPGVSLEQVQADIAALWASTERRMQAQVTLTMASQVPAEA
jgi:hypothetical protein